AHVTRLATRRAGSSFLVIPPFSWLYLHVAAPRTPELEAARRQENRLRTRRPCAPARARADADGRGRVRQDGRVSAPGSDGCASVAQTSVQAPRRASQTDRRE